MKYYLKPIFTMPKYVLAICLLVIISPLFGQEKTLDELNDLAKSIRCTEILKADSISDLVIQKATEMELPSALGTAYLNKGASAVCGGKMDEGISYFKIALNAFNSINDQKGEFEAYELYASVYLRKSMPDSAFHFSKNQLATAEALEDSVLIATAYLTMSSIHTIIAQNDSIVYYALAGLKTLGDIENDNLRGRLNIGLGNAYYQNEDYDLAVKYYTQARRYIDEDDLNMRRIEHNLGSVFTRLKAYDSSFYYLNHTIEINKKNGVKLFLAYNYQSLAENYSASGDCENSIKYNLLALEMSNELNERRSKSGVLGNISKCYLQIGKVEEAIESAKQAVELTKEIGDQDKLADSYFLLSKAYEQKGDYKLAFDAHKRFYTMDSLNLGRDKQATISLLETKYETEKKEAEIASLSQQSTIQSLELEQKNLAITVGGVLVLLIGGLVFFVTRQKSLKSSQSQMELEQRFLRSQLNPHFISNALLAVQNFMLKNQSEMAVTYLSKFSKLMRETLENSRKEFIPLEDELAMLTNFMDVHKMRLNDTFEYEVHVSDEIDPEVDTIPPMFVQPFVENAIEHGISQADGLGKIDLFFEKEQDYISIVIKDNGGGYVQSNTQAKDHVSLSTTIIRERMEIFNKTLKRKIQLVLADIKNEDGKTLGAQVELKVPFRYI